MCSICGDTGYVRIVTGNNTDAAGANAIQSGYLQECTCRRWIVWPWIQR
jgi:hypothetical protein